MYKESSTVIQRFVSRAMKRQSTTLLVISILALPSFIAIQNHPDCELIGQFINKHGCPFVALSGSNNAAITEIGASVFPVPVILKHDRDGDSPDRGSRRCQAVTANSARGLKLSNVEKLAEGSSKSLIIVSGTDRREVDLSGVTRPIFYVEERHLGTNSVIHVFCPKLKRDGQWFVRVAIWRHVSLLTNRELMDFCPSALFGASVTVAWALSQCNQSFLANMPLWS